MEKSKPVEQAKIKVPAKPQTITAPTSPTVQAANEKKSAETPSTSREPTKYAMKLPVPPQDGKYLWGIAYELGDFVETRSEYSVEPPAGAIIKEYQYPTGKEG
ncbi:MAG: hypothetical protein QMD77_04165 [Patescibacteria group bacterium]|nr:hypothetical protein [Patescibacteria group bacterium]